MVVLDKSKPFGTIIGNLEDPARFSQGGIDFDLHGNPVGGQPVAEVAEVAEVKAPNPLMPNIKNWTRAAVLNHLSEKFPHVDIDQDLKAAELKSILRGLYTDGG